MAEYVYPAIFHANSDGSYTITFPDLSGCISEGKSIEDALYMAQDALTQYMTYAAEVGEGIPQASDMKSVSVSDGEFVNLIYAKVRDNKAVRRNVSIPKWMDDMAVSAGLSLSRVLQDALTEKLDA